MRIKSLALVVAPVLAASWLAPTAADAAPAAGDAVPGPYVASAHSDIVDLATLKVLPSVIPGGGELASVKVGHAKATADSAAADRATAESANLDAALLGQSIPVDAVTATAPPTAPPKVRTLAPLPLAPLADIGLLSGSVEATDGGTSCVPAVNGFRTTSRAATSLAGATVGRERPERLPRPGRRLADHRDHPAGRQQPRHQRRGLDRHHDGRRHPAARRRGAGPRVRPGRAARDQRRYDGHRRSRRPADHLRQGRRRAPSRSRSTASRSPSRSPSRGWSASRSRRSTRPW